MIGCVVAQRSGQQEYPARMVISEVWDANLGGALAAEARRDGER